MCESKTEYGVFVLCSSELFPKPAVKKTKTSFVPNKFPFQKGLLVLLSCCFHSSSWSSLWEFFCVSLLNGLSVLEV